jgi:uncharacterized protein (TIGR00299 family) protein
MLLGALIDAGVPLESVRDALGSLKLDGVDVSTTRVVRAGISATKFRVSGPGVVEADGAAPDGVAATSAPQVHEHEPGGRHAHRHLPQIVSIIQRSALSAPAREKAIGLMERMAAAEAAVHGIPIERVHLHEVGAVDSIVDVVGTVRALEVLGVDEIWASPLNTGSGTVRCAHGTYPVPAPATLTLVKGVPIYADGPAVELLTPTGALLVTGFANGFGPMPPMRADRTGYGAGARDFPSRPNVLRAIVGRRTDTAQDNVVVVLECEVDDMNPQFLGPFMDACLAAGALDVYYTPIFMKKGRPGTLITVLTPVGRREALTALVFRETTSIGVRYHERQRECLARSSVTVSTQWGDIRIKLASSPDAVLNVAPEFDDCARAAKAHGVAVKTVHAAALQAYMNEGAK